MNFQRGRGFDEPEINLIPLIDVLLVILMSNCLNLLGVTPYMQVVLKGAILVVAIWLDNRKQS